MSDDEEQYDSKAHKSLLNAVSSLNQIQHIRKSSRNEAKQQQNEFLLGKASTSSLDDNAFHRSVGTNDIVKLLKNTKKYTDIGKKIKNVLSTKKVLEKPLEKPAADRIKRLIGFDVARKKLGRWDAAVAKMRTAETQVFPLKTETIYVDTGSKALKPSLKSDLAMGLAKADEKLKTLKEGHAGDSREAALITKKLSKKEIIARRKELAYLKMRESQKSAKARLQNKIKSKKYHKLMKRQKMLEQIKEFEILKKSNPDAALEKLNALERSRVIERASLRHKNTGVWAKNLQVRAKYDSSVRKDLAEQLALSRQLTEQKVEACENGENIDQTTDNVYKELNCEYDPFNPWTKSETGNNSKTDAIAEDDNSHWRSYWILRNENEKLLEEHRAEQITEDVVSDLDEKIEEKTKKVSLKQRLKKLKHKRTENGWDIEEVDHIDDIFGQKEDQITDEVGRKLLKLSSKAKTLKSAHLKKPKKNKKEKDELKNLKDLSFMQTAKVPDLDEELNTFNDSNDQSVKQLATNSLSGTAKLESINKSVDSNEKNHLNTGNVDTIDASKLATVKLKQRLDLSNDFGDNLSETDLVKNTPFDDASEKQLTISHAFEDDDILVDFSMDKTEKAEAKNAEIQLSMPGWGSWAGSGIVQTTENSKHKSRRLNLKLEHEKRRDENKEGVYINEDTSKHLRTHLVSNIPFPFTSVKDYEANNRAPIGRNLVTETAFRMLTRPAVITRKGQVIEPMNESDLMRPDKQTRQAAARERKPKIHLGAASKFKKERKHH